MQLYRITHPNPDEDAYTLYKIVDGSNPENLLIQATNTDLAFPPIESGFKLSELTPFIHAGQEYKHNTGALLTVLGRTDNYVNVIDSNNANVVNTLPIEDLATKIKTGVYTLIN